MLDRNIPVGCVGIQSHLRYLNIPIEALQVRLIVHRLIYCGNHVKFVM